MKVFVKIMALCLLWLITDAAMAQGRGDGPQERKREFVDQMKEVLDLTDQQAADIEKIHEKYRKEMRAVFQDAELDRDARREMLGTLRTAQQEEVHGVLTEEQLEKLEAIRTQRQEQRRGKRERMKEVDWEMLKSELKAYHEQNIQPVMMAQREKLEADLAAEDRATIEKLRTTMETIRKEKKSLIADLKTKEDVDKEQIKTELEAFHENYKEEMEILHGLVEKYDPQITALFAEIEPQAKTWGTDMRKIKESYLGEPAGGGPGGKGIRRGNRGHRHGPPPHAGRQGPGAEAPNGMKKGHFLLLDPDNAGAANEQLLNDTPELTVFPNPATNSNTLQYEMIEPGDVRIELRDEFGNVVRVVESGKKQPGTYTIDVDLGNVQPGQYYYAIQTPAGISTEKVTVAK